jgi:hypothetical protein
VGRQVEEEDEQAGAMKAPRTVRATPQRLVWRVIGEALGQVVWLDLSVVTGVTIAEFLGP